MDIDSEAKGKGEVDAKAPATEETNEDETIMIKLRSQPDEHGTVEVFPIPLAAAKLSAFVRDAAPEDNDDDEDDEEDAAAFEIEVSKIQGPCLAKIVDFLTHYQNEPMIEWPAPLSEKGSTFEAVMDQMWYQNFMSAENLGTGFQPVFDLMVGGNFMGIEPLMNLCTLKLAFMFQDKTVPQLQQILRVAPLTKEEEEQAKKDHPWLFKDE